MQIVLTEKIKISSEKLKGLLNPIKIILDRSSIKNNVLKTYKVIYDEEKK